ncbi:MAG: sigma-54-dependent Fis family transcriptional regulator [Bacteroidales bacterium]|nr:sigma-54-dependent Fis family transcriptional regulator [Bacteroidales bacterium]MBQ3976068.1 sigma-54-dependent Fis family transcriptional regulator [Bacteroidales bacterium]
MDSQELQKLKNKFDIIGNDPALNRALETAVAIAPTNLTVLITGESGVGKENIPKIIHQNSLRKSGKYLAVNCGAIPEGTINAELFGHEKGSFTGAIAERKGYFEVADGGTLFLDEIGELPKDTQAMLLRVLQDGEFIKVGSSKVEKTDVRVIAATNINLMHAVSTGKFREDLFYRLNAVQITMPSLRERKDDIYLLFRKFSSDFSERYGMRKVNLTHDAIAMLRNYRWPGNIRQLKNAAESLTALESTSISGDEHRIEIDTETLSKYIPKDDPNALPALVSAPQSSMSSDDKQMIVKALLDLKQEVDRLKSIVASNAIKQAEPQIQEPEEVEWQEPEHKEEPQENRTLSIQEIEKENIARALEKFGGNRKLAAEALGISERTLYRRLKNE